MTATRTTTTLGLDPDDAEILDAALRLYRSMRDLATSYAIRADDPAAVRAAVVDVNRCDTILARLADGASA